MKYSVATLEPWARTSHQSYVRLHVDNPDVDTTCYLLNFETTSQARSIFRFLLAFGRAHPSAKLLIDDTRTYLLTLSVSDSITLEDDCSLTKHNHQQSSQSSVITTRDPRRLRLIAALASVLLPLDKLNFRSSETQPPLPGTFGWTSFSELFSFLSKATVWTLLRNHEYHQDGKFWEKDKDLDILSPKLDLLASALNALPRFGGASSFYTYVDSRILLLDLHPIGDKYYDSLWMRDILQRRFEYSPNLFGPSPYDYLYLLIYHALLQKPTLSLVYLERINTLLAMNSLPCVDASIPEAKQSLLSLLDRFLERHDYCYTFTRESWVNEHNIASISQRETRGESTLILPQIKSLLSALRYRISNKLLFLGRRVSPDMTFSKTYWQPLFRMINRLRLLLSCD